LAVSASPEKGARFRSQALPARLASGILLAALSIAATWAGGWYFAGLLFLVLIVALWEFLRMGVRGGYPVLVGPGLLAGASILILALSHSAENAGLVLIVLAVWMMALSLRSPIKNRAVGLAVTVTGVMYVTGLGLHLLWLRELDRGLPLLVVVLLGTWAADTFAFFVGVRFGRTPLAPEISPGKSVEGLVGGVVGSVVVVAVVSHFFASDLEFLGSLVTGLVIGAVSPIGDLLESMLKRNFDLKDTSRVIPGHGGVLDRIDSLLVTAPVSYYLFRFLLP
jgi:phosphatidate cytidylyltransferase